MFGGEVDRGIEERDQALLRWCAWAEWRRPVLDCVVEDPDALLHEGSHQAGAAAEAVEVVPLPTPACWAI